MKNKHVRDKGILQSVSNCFKLSIKINTCNTAILFQLAMLTQRLFYCSMKLCYETSSRSNCSISLRHLFCFCCYWRRIFTDFMTYTAHFIDVNEKQRVSFFFSTVSRNYFQQNSLCQYLFHLSTMDCVHVVLTCLTLLSQQHK
jgi:hypothetical protein